MKAIGGRDEPCVSDCIRNVQIAAISAQSLAAPRRPRLLWEVDPVADAARNRCSYPNAVGDRDPLPPQWPYGRLDRPIASVPHCERFQVPEAMPRENREGGERPPRAQRCDGDYPDIRHRLRPGRRSDGMNLSQKTGLEAIGHRRGRTVARASP